MRFVCPLIVVKDIARSKDFYQNVLNQKVKFDFGENVTFEGGFAIHLESHYKKLLANESCEIVKKSHNFELYFETDNLEETYNKLKEHNINFVHELVEQPWGQRVIRFYDLDKHIIEVGETMEAVVLRFYQMGLSADEISKRSSMPPEFVQHVISSGTEKRFDK